VFRIQLAGKLIPWDDYVRYLGSRWASGKGEIEVQDVLVCHRSSWQDFMSNPTAFHAASLQKVSEIGTSTTHDITSVNLGTKGRDFGY